MKDKLKVAMRVFLGLVFLVFGLNGFLGFLPMPEMNAEASSFMMALGATGFMFPLIKLIEIITGAMILFNKREDIALVYLAPILTVIFFFHLFLDQSGLFLAFVLFVVFKIRVWENRESYKSLIDMEALMDKCCKKKK